MTGDVDDEVRHALRLKGMAPAQALAAALDRDADEVSAALDRLAVRGEAIERSGRITGWVLTAVGREHNDAVLATARKRPDTAELHDEYTAFGPVNVAFKAICTRWQLIGTGDDAVPNGHTDPSYDAAVLADLAGVHDQALVLGERMGQMLGRFGRYGARLTSAKRRLDSGDPSALLQPMSDSYHDVWMEWHQDLLLTLGLTRGADDA
jgi:hypothetical protein